MQVPLNHFVGVDVSKAELVVATHGQACSLSLPNECAAIVQWLRTLAPGSLVAMESTGRYHQLLANLAAGMGLSVFVLNARDVYFYAKALGARGKTDRVDARVIARYLAEHHDRLHPYLAPPCVPSRTGAVARPALDRRDQAHRLARVAQDLRGQPCAGRLATGQRLCRLAAHPGCPHHGIDPLPRPTRLCARVA